MSKRGSTPAGTNTGPQPHSDDRQSGSNDGGQQSNGLIVGIGASAGGLEAFKAFFGSMPVDSGMAFVLVQHLSPDHTSMLAEILARLTPMPVLEGTTGMRANANHVYVIPPNSTLTIKDRHLQVARPAPPRELRRPIDTFLRPWPKTRKTTPSVLSLRAPAATGALG